MTGPVAWLLVQPIRGYQRFISPYSPPSCRYYPCCSAYGVTALRRHGAARGLWLTARRLGRCNPWSTGGVDHVPPADLSWRGQNRWRKHQDQTSERQRERGGLAGSSPQGAPSGAGTEHHQRDQSDLSAITHDDRSPRTGPSSSGRPAA
ncbi:membrane protein insertion efficiency factor YidD [Nakamurella flavida]|uniref:Putative membrane protein insertion efficiency factor n=1 Tax=Nakamurella flavida TaxID=363630 RepID=A0A938YFN7_9ACTN|nr:membrane protein insertion efficiency factor YidD [Nakamurella flavida]MBM9476811.1 membrane protein insertion efficiency factor YidD [Nakamurella flavida]MDP9778748.1 putative membrane protein insertion efficiency factor [Nakamurella flavida]